MQGLQKAAKKAADLITQSDGLIIGAGAGMGIDSGLPDFRGASGFWNAYPAFAEVGLEFQEVANPETFFASPKLAWGFYGHRLNLYRDTQPHLGFSQLKAIGEQLPQGYQVFTSNVDGQFQKAGFDENRVYECHGSIHYLQCSMACRKQIWSADSLQVTYNTASCQATSDLPKCPDCGAIARPNILLFDDFYWLSDRTDVQGYRKRKRLLNMQSPVIIETGAGTNIASVRHFCEEKSWPLIRINPDESETPNARDVSMNCGALTGLKAIIDELKQRNFFKTPLAQS